MTDRVRISVTEPELMPHYETGWSYVMPDFDNRDRYVIEWRSDKLPVYPRVPNNSSQESADDANGHKRPA